MHRKLVLPWVVEDEELCQHQSTSCSPLASAALNADVSSSARNHATLIVLKSFHLSPIAASVAAQFGGDTKTVSLVFSSSMEKEVHVCVFFCLIRSHHIFLAKHKAVSCSRMYLPLFSLLRLLTHVLLLCWYVLLLVSVYFRITNCMLCIYISRGHRTWTVEGKEEAGIIIIVLSSSI